MFQNFQGGYKIRDQEGIHFITFAVVEWADVFTRNLYAQIVIDSLNYCVRNKGLKVHAWCLMSNHMHLVLSVEAGNRLSDVLRDFKKFTSRTILLAIEANFRESRRTWMLELFLTYGNRNVRNEKYQFWRQKNRPMELYSNKFLDQKIGYTHRNPVVAGIVDKPEDYRYSSARDYIGTKGLVDVSLIEINPESK